MSVRTDMCADLSTLHTHTHTHTHTHSISTGLENEAPQEGKERLGGALFFLTQDLTLARHVLYHLSRSASPSWCFILLSH
jgi:hypothetical protein